MVNASKALATGRVGVAAALGLLGCTQAIAGETDEHLLGEAEGGTASVEFALHASNSPEPASLESPSLNFVLPTDAKNDDRAPISERIHRENRRIVQRELVYQAFNVIDAVQTIGCVQRTDCREMNPILGERPSVRRIVGFKLATGAGHYLVTHLLRQHAPRSVGSWQVSTMVVQGGAVAWNLRYSF